MIWKIRLSNIGDNGQNANDIAATCSEIGNNGHTVAIMHANSWTMRNLLGTSILKASAIGGELYTQYMGHPIKENNLVRDSEIMVITYNYEQFDTILGQ